jgi:Flp pilus assembly pilin Flp
MSHLVSLIQRFSNDENGAALVEYAVIFAVLVAGTVTALNLISPQLIAIFTNVSNALLAIAGLTP